MSTYAAEARRVRILAPFAPIKSAALYTMIQHLCSVAEARDRSYIAHGYTSASITTGLSMVTVTRAAKKLHERKWVTLHRAFASGHKRAATRWTLHFDKMLKGLVKMTSEESGVLLGLPPGWKDLPTEELHPLLDSLADEKVDRIVPTVGPQGCPVVHGTGLHRQVWDVIHVAPEATVKDLRSMGFTAQTAPAHFKKATEALTTVPDEVEAKFESIQKQRQNLIEKTAAYQS